MILVITTADTEVLSLSQALVELPDDFPAVRAINPTSLDDAGLERLLGRDLLDVDIAVVRLLGGRRAWEEPFRRLAQRCLDQAVPLVALPGDQQPDAELAAACTAPPELVRQAYEYFQHGGSVNLRNLLFILANAASGGSYDAAPARLLPWEGVYHPDLDPEPPLEALTARWRPGQPTIGLLFYRAHWMSGNLAWLDTLIREIEARGANTLPVFCYSLLHGASPGEAQRPAVVERYLLSADGRPRIDALISTLSFSLARVTVQGAAMADTWSAEVLESLGVPALQGIISTASRERWLESAGGLSPIDTAMNVAMPEFDGRIITVPICFKEQVQSDPRTGGSVSRYVPDPERVARLASLAVNWAALRRTPNADKRVAIVLSNYPTRNARIGNAVGLDTPASVLNVLHALHAAGYTVGELPDSGDDLIHALIDRCTYDTEHLTDTQARSAEGRVPPERYRVWFRALDANARTGILERWSDPPGSVYVIDGQLMIAGLRFGNVFVGIQPPRGFGENPVAIYHHPDLAPTHHYLAFYRWLRDDFGAHAVIHVGKHGTLEWLPGKSVGLSGSCYPDAVLTDLPLFYPFIVNNPGEGAQAKRRAHATIVDHLVPAMTTAESYNEIMALEQLMDEYYQVQTLDPAKLPLIRQRIWDIVQTARLHHDLAQSQVPDDFDAFLLHLDGYICELKDAQIRDGLHVFGQPPEGEQEVGLLLALTRLDNPGVPSLRSAIAEVAGLDYRVLESDRTTPFGGSLPAVLNGTSDIAAIRLNGDVIERIEAVGRQLLTNLQAADYPPQRADELASALLSVDDRKRHYPPQSPRKTGGGTAGADREGAPTPQDLPLDNEGLEQRLPPWTGGLRGVTDARASNGHPQPSLPPFHGGTEGGHQEPDHPLRTTLQAIATTIRPALARTTDEIDNLIRGLDGRYVPAGPSGAPTRGLANVLPTGRNFYSVDPHTLPSQAAWEVGRGLAEALIERYLAEEGQYPRTVGLVIWGTSAMRTHGDDVAEALWLLGVRPLWQPENRRVRGLEVIPLEELGRPRIDVTLRISGFFRDAFANVVHLLDDAVRLVAGLDEPDDANYVSAHVRADVAEAEARGIPDAEARRFALFRVFGSKPGTYGAGILPLLDERNWTSDQDLAAVYRAWGCYAYSREDYGRESPSEFERRFAQIVVAVKNQDNREHDIFDSDDYMQFHGGMIATVRALTGQNPRRYFGDSANPSFVRVRDLADEARRVFRTRVVNPKWIASMQRHGYKGAFELAATTDYLFGYDATAQVVDDWMYERLTEAYVLDPEVQSFLREKNPWALRGIIERLFEAIDRQLWEAPPEAMTRAMREIYLDTDAALESRSEP